MRPVSPLLTAVTAGANWAKVVDMTIGGTTALDVHCEASWPACSARVEKPFDAYECPLATPDFWGEDMLPEEALYPK